jgi:16S rRNA processing protein RimM
VRARVPLGARTSASAPPAGRPKPPAADLSGHVAVGQVGAAHGVRGEVRLKSFTADPGKIADYGPFLTRDGRRVAIESLRPQGKAPDLFVARLAGVATREAAEALCNALLHAPRERLPAPEEDEFYIADLVGLAVEDEAGNRIGRIVQVADFGAGDLLEIAPVDGDRTAWLAFTKAFVPRVEITAGRVVARPPEDLFAAPGAPEPGEA